MPNLEQIVIAGHLGKDAVMRETSAGHVTDFTVAVNHGKGDKKQATWYTVNCWHGTAKGAQHLCKGEAVICIGNMRCNKYEKDGQKRYYWTLQAHTVGKALYVKEEMRQVEPEPPVESLNDPGEEDDSSIPF